MATGHNRFSVVEEFRSPAFCKIAAPVSPRRGYPQLPDLSVNPLPSTLSLSLSLSLYIYIYIYIQGVSRLVDITAGGDFLGLCDQKSSYKHVSDFARLRSYDRLKLRIEGNDY